MKSRSIRLGAFDRRLRRNRRSGLRATSRVTSSVVVAVIRDDGRGWSPWPSGLPSSFSARTMPASAFRMASEAALPPAIRPKSAPVMFGGIALEHEYRRA
ncbi:hypothetical protein QEZ48_07220 [Aquamicrobium lusatiense]|uniref:hypothetical protein n=1 Tax=Aquamicrobium lusatiense TaxID=89772 RepID=UPI002458D035|nr:hypothetical protein [Aquamicrobium lusatiense]MDH4990622.1 hypothetical protein [Aquamicrobium lusatiense]